MLMINLILGPQGHYSHPSTSPSHTQVCFLKISCQVPTGPNPWLSEGEHSLTATERWLLSGRVIRNPECLTQSTPLPGLSGTQAALSGGTHAWGLGVRPHSTPLQAAGWTLRLDVALTAQGTQCFHQDI